MTATTKHAVSRQRAASHTTTERTAPELTPVTEARVRECEESARYWARELGPFAGELGKKADRLAIYSAALSSVTGLAVWSTLATSTKWPAVLAVSLVSFLSAVVAVIPKIRGYADGAKAAASLASRYGSVLGELVDARELFRIGHEDAAAHGEAAVRKFEALRVEKEALKPYPESAAHMLAALRAQDAQRWQANLPA